MKNRLPIIILVLLVFLWHIAAEFRLINSDLVSPYAIFSRMINLFTIDPSDAINSGCGYILTNIFISLKRMVIGLTIGCITGIILAFVNTIYNRVDQIISPILVFFAPIPIVVWIPFFIMLFGTSEIGKICLIALATFFLVFTNLYTAYKSVNSNYIEVGELYEKNNWEKFKLIYFPSGLESFFTSLRLSVAIGWIVIFVVEFSYLTEGKAGLGYFIEYSRLMGKLEEQFVGVIILAIISYIMDVILKRMQHHFLQWQNKKE